MSKITNCYYLEGSCDGPTGASDAVEEAIICSEDYMQNDDFLKELNEYVDKYNQEHKTETEFIELKKWKMDGKIKYPIPL